MTKNIKQTILDVIDDMSSNFLYYDRKDSNLTLKKLNKAVKKGKITLDEMVDQFRKNLEETFTPH